MCNQIIKNTINNIDGKFMAKEVVESNGKSTVIEKIVRNNC